MAKARLPVLDRVSWAEAFDDFMCSLAGRAVSTRAFYRSHVGQFARWAADASLIVAEFRPRDFRAYVSLRGEQVSVQTQLHCANCLRVFFRFCLRNRYMPADPAAGFVVPRPPQAVVRTPSADELKRLLSAIERKWDIGENPIIRFQPRRWRHFYRARDYALVSFLIETGCRISDAIGLRLADFDVTNLVVTMRGESSKSKRTKRAPITRALVDACAAWLRERAELESLGVGDVARGLPARCGEHFFVGSTGQAVDREVFARSWRKYLDFAGLERFGRHGVRHYTLSAMCRVNGRSAQLLADHKDARTTALYDTGTVEGIRADHAAASPLGSVLGDVLKKKDEKRPRVR